MVAVRAHCTTPRPRRDGMGRPPLARASQPLQAIIRDLACWEDRLLPKTSGLLPHTQPERLDLQRMYRQSSPPTSVRVPRRAPTSLGGWEERLLPSRRGENAARTVRDLSDSRWEDRLLP